MIILSFVACTALLPWPNNCQTVEYEMATMLHCHNAAPLYLHDWIVAHPEWRVRGYYTCERRRQ